MKTHHIHFRRNALALMVSLAATGSAFAADDTVEEVVVSGFRESLAKALDIKRESTTQVDAIVAEDIGKFPDMNLAESLQRVSGISIDRDGGEGRQISVRGLGSDFTRVRLNGMEALSTSGQGSGGANRSRGFDFNTFASELFSEVKVNKTQSASMDEGSLGSTVDLRAGRPFDYKGFKLMGSAQGSYNDLTGKTNPRLSGLISNTTEDGRWGALASFSYSERNLVEEGFNPVRFDWGNGAGSASNKTPAYGFCSPVGVTPQVPATSSSTGASTANCATGIPRPANTAENVKAYTTAVESWHPRYPGWRRQEYDLSRLGATGSIQFKPDDATTMSLDVLYSDYQKNQREDTLGINLHRAANLGGKTQIIVRQAEKDALNRLTYAVFDNVDLRSESAMFEENTKFAQYSFSVSHDISDDTHIDAQVGTSNSNYARPINSLLTLDNTNLQGVTWDARESLKTPKMGYGIDLTDPANWKWIGQGAAANSNISEVRINPMYVDNQIDTAKVDVSHQLNDVFKLSAGLAIKDYDMESKEFRHVSYGALPQALPAGSSIANLSQVLTGYGEGLNGAAPSSWLVPDFNKIADLLGIYCNCDTGIAGGNYTLIGVGSPNATAANFSVEEASNSAYIQVDFSTEFLGKDLRGNLGTRYVTTEITSTGWIPCPSLGTVNCSGSTPFLGLATQASGSVVAAATTRYYAPLEATHEYNDMLPALNLSWSLTDDFILRFAAAKTMARPQLDALQPAISGAPSTYSNDDALYAINAGNPKLDPYRADTYDLSAEWYFDEGSLVSAAVFHKDIKSYIQKARQVLTWDQTGWPTAFLPIGFDGNETFSVQSFYNTPGGALDGFEVGYEQQFTFLPGIWKDFGLKANYTRVKSEMNYVQTSTVDPTTRAVTTSYITNNLQNMSPSSYNATFYYDNGTFSARISAAHRDGYITKVISVPDAGTDLSGNAVYTADVEGKQGTTQIDFNMSYEFSKAVTVTLAATNLTDQFDDRYGHSVIQYPMRYSHTGREYNVGVRYKF